MTTEEMINDTYEASKDKKRCIQDFFDSIIDEVISSMRRSYHAIIDPEELKRVVFDMISQKESEWKTLVDIISTKPEIKDVPDLHLLIPAIRLYAAAYGNVFNLQSLIDEGNKMAVCLAYHMKNIPILTMVDFPINENFLLGCIVKLHNMESENAEEAISIIMGWIYRNRVRLDDIKFDLANFDQATYMLSSKYGCLDDESGWEEVLNKNKDLDFDFDKESTKYGIA